MRTLTAPLAGTFFGTGFNPTVDRLRSHAAGGQNHAINVDDGVTAVNAPLAYASGDITRAGPPTSSAPPTPTASIRHRRRPSRDGAAASVLFGVNLQTGRVTRIGRINNPSPLVGLAVAR